MKSSAPAPSSSEAGVRYQRRPQGVLLPTTSVKHPGFITRIRNLERMREITAVAVRHGFGYFFERYRLFGLLPRWRRSSHAPPLHRGRHIREMLEELGPTFVKFGQLLSTRPDIIPADIVAELVLLQDRVPPFPFSVVEEVISEDFGLSVKRAFAQFSSEPLAAASIGQVHEAILPGGHPVVVKVQRPEAARQIRKDIELLMQFAELLEGRLSVGFSPVELVREFARSINRELDYVLEARNAERFAINFVAYENVKIPRIYWQYCSSRVLTMERLEGPTLNSEFIFTIPLPERRRIAENLVDCWYRQIFVDGFFHADPHPANVVYLGEGRLGLLDFGLAGFLREGDLQEAMQLFLHVMGSDIPGIKRSLRRLGVRWNPSVDELVSQTIEEAFSRYFGCSLATIEISTLLHQVFDVVYALQLQLPNRFLLLDKAMLTLEGVVSSIYPDLNIFDLAEKYTGELRRRRLEPRYLAGEARRNAAEYAQLIRDYPLQLHDVLEELRAGELEMKYHHTGLEDFVHRLDVITNRLVVALVCIALGATSTAVAILVEKGPHIAGLSVWGLPGFAGSLFFGAWLIWAIIRSGRL